MTSSMEPRAAAIWELKKTPDCGGQGFPAHQLTAPNIPMGSLFPAKSPGVTTHRLIRFSLPLQLTAIQMGAKTNPHGATLCMAFRISRKG